MSKLTVLLTTEGTYPFHKGGVSTWCDVLIRQLPEIDFLVFAVMMHPYLTPQYPLPRNLKQLVKVPLWGLTDPLEFSWRYPLTDALAIKEATTTAVITEHFLPLFTKLLQSIHTFSDTFTAAVPTELAELFTQMHTFFQQFDYHATLHSAPVWQTFHQSFQHGLATQQPTLAEAVQALQLLYHFLLVLHFPVPRADLSHAAAAAFCGLPCVIAKLRYGTPYLLTEHGIYLREQYLNLGKQISSHFVRRFLYQLISIVVTTNYHCADQISPVCHYNTRWEKWWHIPANRIQVIYNGADPERFYPATSPPQNPRPLVATVGLIFPLKGTLDLIAAAHLVHQQLPSVEFRVYGHASDTAYFAECQTQVAALKLQATFIFAGSTNNPCQVYQMADIVVLPSISEGFPYVIIEAMLAGAAIVATDVGGVREALADTGLVVPPRQPAAMATALLTLLTNPEHRQHLGQRAHQRARQHFTEAQFLAAHRTTYQRLTQSTHLD
jgi:polysaccharide biosynthesis protein PelF